MHNGNRETQTIITGAAATLPAASLSGSAADPGSLHAQDGSGELRRVAPGVTYQARRAGHGTAALHPLSDIARLCRSRMLHNERPAAPVSISRYDYAESMNGGAVDVELDRACVVDDESTRRELPVMYCRACGCRLSQYNALSRERGVCAHCDTQSRRPLDNMPHTDHPDHLMTRDEAAEYLHLSGEMVRILCKRGELRRGSWEKKRLILRESVERYAYTRSLGGKA